MLEVNVSSVEPTGITFQNKTMVEQRGNLTTAQSRPFCGGGDSTAVRGTSRQSGEHPGVEVSAIRTNSENCRATSLKSDSVGLLWLVVVMIEAICL